MVKLQHKTNSEMTRAQDARQLEVCVGDVTRLRPVYKSEGCLICTTGHTQAVTPQRYAADSACGLQ